MKRRSLTARPIELAAAFVAGAFAALVAPGARGASGDGHAFALAMRWKRRWRPSGSVTPAIPQLVRGRLVVPLRNDSPAVAQLVVAELEVGEVRHIELLRSLAAWAVAAVVVEIRVGELPDFTIGLVVHGAGGFQRASWRWRSLTRRYERLL